MPRGDESRRIARRHIQKLLEYRPAIVEAAKDYEIGSFAQFYTQKRVTLAPWVLAGIISRETNVANIEGDYIDPKRKLSPRGFGLCQITIPYHRAWVDKWLAGTLPGYEGKPRDPTANIRKGAEILSERIRYFRDKGPRSYRTAPSFAPPSPRTTRPSSVSPRSCAQAGTPTSAQPGKTTPRMC